MSETAIAGDPWPHFDDPPVVEVALGVQFQPLFSLRPIELAPLREHWRTAYPLVEEHPPVAPQLEAERFSAQAVQVVVGPALQTRVWFLTGDRSELVQLQHDRLTMNWRRVSPTATYPRYSRLRRTFHRRSHDLDAYVGERLLSSLSITQVEVSYINAVDTSSEEELGHIDRLLRAWQPVTDHHLGLPTQAEARAVFPVPELGRPPVRLYVSVEPGYRPDGGAVLMLNLTLRGAPSNDTLGEAVRFMDFAHDHVVRSFLELTSPEMQTVWGRHDDPRA